MNYKGAEGDDETTTATLIKTIVVLVVEAGECRNEKNRDPATINKGQSGRWDSQECAQLALISDAELHATFVAAGRSQPARRN